MLPDENKETSAQETQENVDREFLTTLRTKLMDVSLEVAERNEKIEDRDQYIYSDKLEKMIDIPVGHDFTPVNWLKRTVEIHRTMFMGRPFSLVSSYDVEDDSLAQDEQDKATKGLNNKKQKEFAEQRKLLIDSIIRDNGGHALFADGAESASAIGNWVVKTYYDDDQKKFVISPVEAVENCYAVWSRDDFRQYDVFAYVYQITRQQAAEIYSVSEDVATSPLGSPFMFASANPPGVQIGGANSTLGATGNVSGEQSGQPMVTVIEVTGKLDGWTVKDGKLAKTTLGNEQELNAVFIGDELQKLISDPKKLPRYYIFPNKRIRRRAWGVSDITDAAINLNVTYIETLSDWRTIASKVNFPKYKGFNFGPDTQTPKFKPRKIELLPLGDGQDMQLLQTGQETGIEWTRQLDEVKAQYIRETAISRVLFDDPTISLNSNQALMTSMKPTTDVAETKKQLWEPILTKMFNDALETVAAHQPEIKDIIEGNWWLKVQWPSILQKEDPIFQQMLLNRKNAGTLSLQSYLEMQGESKEELDRITDELSQPVTASILGNTIGELASYTIKSSLGIPPWGYVVPKVNLRGDLTPDQEGNLASNYGFNQGPFQPTAGPQGYTGTRATDNLINQGYTVGQYPNQMPVEKTPSGAPAQIATPAQNTPGSQPMSQPGSGATTTSPQGALNQQTQANGG